ncbi:MAG: tRNA uridine-5-carboxymethylaminomethyl(34) synthesis GTPase MnmE [Blastocatellia bacterium]
MSRPDQTTIAAIATPPGAGGIGIIRLSGPDALSLALRLLRDSAGTTLAPNHSVLHLIVNRETDEVIDETIVTYYKGPHSFTGEDVVEISCHGSPVVLAEVLRLLIGAGATPAQAGEFSLRAFFNQRIDLSQAEAINDLIHARTRYQARIAARQVRGEISRLLQPIKEGLIELIVHFESTIEFVEDDLDPLNLRLYLARMDEYAERLESLASSYRLGRMIRTGVRLALIGLPNVGKSSIFNALLGFDRAIVTHLPGTTRDTLSEGLSIEGIPMTLVDTAGIRETEDLVERIGVERTKSAIADADMIVAVVDSQSSLPDEEKTLFGEFPIDLYVINKCDLPGAMTAELLRPVAAGTSVARVSALTGDGIAELRDAIHRHLVAGARTGIEDAIITNERHYAALEEALASLKHAREDLAAGFTEEIALTHLHRALRSLGIVTGETLITDILNQIFSTFCIGK